MTPRNCINCAHRKWDELIISHGPERGNYESWNAYECSKRDDVHVDESIPVAELAAIAATCEYYKRVPAETTA